MAGPLGSFLLDGERGEWGGVEDQVEVWSASGLERRRLSVQGGAGGGYLLRKPFGPLVGTGGAGDERGGVRSRRTWTDIECEENDYRRVLHTKK